MYDIDDDDDYELPSLSDRVQAASKPCAPSKHFSKSNVTSDSECEDEFLKFSEKIRKTPCSAIRFLSNSVTPSHHAEAKIIKSSEDIYYTPRSNIDLRTYLSFSSDSESEESELLKFSDRIRNTPRPNLRQCDPGKNHSEMLSSISSPKTQSLQFDMTSDSESEFLKFSERIRNTPCSEIKKNHQESSESDSDDSFFTPRRLPKTPVSLTCPAKTNSSSLKVLGEKNVFSKEVKKAHALQKSNCHSVAQLQNEKEYMVLFPSKNVNASYLKDPALCTRKLYEFFNRKIFSSQLPDDMRLIWDGSLSSTAGLTECRKKNNIYSCSIKLSSKILTSFDRMRDTLLHEMCHAAVWIINHRNDHHGPLWKIWASNCKLILPFLSCPERCHNYDLPYRVWYQCPSCKTKVGRCKQVKKLQNSICKKCKVPVVVVSKE